MIVEKKNAYHNATRLAGNITKIFRRMYDSSLILKSLSCWIKRDFGEGRFPIGEFEYPRHLDRIFKASKVAN